MFLRLVLPVKGTQHACSPNDPLRDCVPLYILALPLPGFKAFSSFLFSSDLVSISFSPPLFCQNLGG